MTPAEIQRLIANLPQDREIVVIIARAACQGIGEPGQQDVVSLGSWAGAATGPERSSRLGQPGATAPVAVARKLLRDDAHARPSISQWSAQLNGALSVRELQRAVKGKVLAAEPRGTGRGHGAVVITPSAMVGYLETRERVVAGDMPAPAWFVNVVRGGGDANH